MRDKTGCVYLVGAGCGDADLITLRGLSLLRRCDAVVYDDLIDRALLDAVPAGAEKRYMGKRQGRHSAPQEEICRTLIQLAREGKQVVRLKGGDPFVFGRGGEEMTALQAAGIPCRAVPGISSAIAIPAAAGIPVTCRGVSRSVHIVTGHTADTPDGLPEDLDLLAGTRGTLVFLMGLGRLEAIAAGLTAAGMPPETPAAVISDGSAPHPAAVRGTLRDIACRTRQAGVQPPAVIVVGQTAAMDLAGTAALPLAGVRVGVTGTPAMAEKLTAALRAQGARPCLAERSLVEPLPVSFDWETLADGRPKWVVLTSGNGVRLLFRHLARQRMDLRRLQGCRFAVIGGSTGAVLESYGVYPDLCPEIYTSQALGEALCRQAEPGKEALLFRSAQGSPVLPRLLRQAGIPCRDIPLYDLRADMETAEAARPSLSELDYLTFSSAGGLELFLETQGALPEQAVCVCIGETTAAALRRHTDRPFLTAEETSAEGMVRAILAHRRER